MNTNSIDVLIVGAGPVGLFCAYELTRQGLTCRIIDKKPGISQHSKALGIHIRTLDVFDDCGLLPDFLAQGHPVEGVIFKSSGREIINATFTGIEANHHYILDIPQNQTEAILDKACQMKGIQVEWDTEMVHIHQSPTGVSTTIKKPNNRIEIVESAWLIGCDGAHSTTRHALDEPFIGSDYPQTWWLADLHVQWSQPDNRMMIYISDQGPLACFPMEDNRYRIVMTAAQELDEDPSLEQVQEAFAARCSDPAILSQPIWLAQFKIHHRQVNHYRQDRIFLAGDAAHIHSPMGGQGLNTGLQDVYNLAWKLALVQKGRAHEKLLDTYQLERYPVGKEVLRKTHLMTKMILLTSPLAIRLRNRLLSWLASLPRLRNKMVRNIAELTISYAKSPITARDGELRGLEAGEYCPTFVLSNLNTGQPESSLNMFHDPCYHLFLFCGLKGKNLDRLKQTAEAITQSYPGMITLHLVLTSISDSIQIPYNIWLDPDKKVHQRFRIKKPSALLIRPDKYIGLVQTPLKLKGLQHYLQQWYFPEVLHCETLVATE